MFCRAGQAKSKGIGYIQPIMTNRRNRFPFNQSCRALRFVYRRLRFNPVVSLLASRWLRFNPAAPSLPRQLFPPNPAAPLPASRWLSPNSVIASPACRQLRFNPAAPILPWFPWLPLFICLLLSYGCSEGPAPVLRIDGSSTLFPLAEAISEKYSRAHPDRKVVVGLSGTGGGFRKLARGEIEICMASRPLGAGDPPELSKALRDGRLREIPVARDAVVVAVHPDNHWVDSVEVAALARIWHSNRQGTPTYWSELNPQAPRSPIHLFGPGPGSGTFDFFTHQILGQSGHGRGDYSANEIDPMTLAGIAGDPLALGYFGYTYYQRDPHRVKALGIRVSTVPGSGYAWPDSESVGNGRYSILSRHQYLYVRTDGDKTGQIRHYVQFFLSSLARSELGDAFLPLSRDAYDEQIRVWSENPEQRP